MILTLIRSDQQQQHTRSLRGKSVAMAELALLYCCAQGQEQVEQSQTPV